MLTTALLSTTVPIVVLIITLATESSRARRRRLFDETLDAIVAVVTSADKRRRQLGVLLAMANRSEPRVVDVFSLKNQPAEDVTEALKRYAKILDDSSDARARVLFLLPTLAKATNDLESSHRSLRRVVSGYSITSGSDIGSVTQREAAFAEARTSAEASAAKWAVAARIALRVQYSLLRRASRRFAQATAKSFGWARSDKKEISLE